MPMDDLSMSVVAAWQVSGETFSAMADEAWSDGELFMEGFSVNMYNIQVVNCQPRRKFDDRGNEVGKFIKDGKIEEWEGVAVLSWLPSSSSSSALSAQVPGSSLRG